MGWSRLLTEDIIQIPKIGIIGMHPAPLPYGKGRHPVIWTIILGLKRTKVCLFKIDKEIDNGIIIKEKELMVSKDETAFSLLKKIANITSIMLINVIKALIKKKIIMGKKQKRVFAWDWRKRSYNDGIINFNFNSILIYRML